MRAVTVNRRELAIVKINSLLAVFYIIIPLLYTAIYNVNCVCTCMLCFAHARGV